MRRLLTLLAVLACAAAQPASAEDRVVNFYNWSDYIDPAVLERFTRETGIQVRYDVYDSLETLEGKLLAGHSGYDIVVPTNEPTFSRLVRSGALLPLDKAKLPNLKNLDPALMQRVATSDPGNKYGAIYLWGTVGLGYDPAKVKALDPTAPTDSWDLLMKPDNAKKLASCGITVMDTPTDVIPSVLKYLGHSPDSVSTADLADVSKALMAIRPYIRNFSNGGIIEQMASGETCLALDYSGDIIQAAARAKEAGKGLDLHYIAPKEGAQLTFDMLAIPKDAPHAADALALVNFLEQPDVMAAITNKVRYPNAVPASRGAITPDIAGDPGIFPPQDATAHFFTVTAVSADATRARGRMWARFKAGH